MAHLSDADVALLNAGLPWLKAHSDPDGATVFYRETGPPQGDVVLLLHGLGASSVGWRAVIAGMAPGARVIAWDAPGYGGSAPLPPADGDAFSHVDALRAFCDGIGVREAHVVGSSWGGALAAAFAKRHSAYVRSLTLLAPNRCFGWLPPADREELRRRLLDPALVAHAAKSDFLAMLVAPDSNALVAERAFALKDQLTEVGYAQAVDMMSRTDTLANAGSITVPTIVLAGEQDVLAPIDDHARPIADAIGGAKLVRVPDCGHLIELERPHVVLSAIAEQLTASRLEACDAQH